MEHLTQNTARVLESSTRSRLAWTNRRRVYEYPELKAAVETIDTALYQRRAGEPAPQVVLTGAARNGKTFILEEVAHSHSNGFTTGHGTGVHKPIIWPAEPMGRNSTQLAETIGDRFHGWPGVRERNRGHPQDLAIEFLKVHTPTEMIILDELGGNPTMEMTDYADRISAEAQTAIVYTEEWSEEEGDAWSKDQKNRLHCHLPSWRPGSRLAHLLQAVEMRLPLAEASNLADPETMWVIADKGERTIGGILSLIRNAATGAVVENRKRLTINDLG